MKTIDSYILHVKVSQVVILISDANVMQAESCLVAGYLLLPVY